MPVSLSGFGIFIDEKLASSVRIAGIILVLRNLTDLIRASLTTQTTKINRASFLE